MCSDSIEYSLQTAYPLPGNWYPVSKLEYLGSILRHGNNFIFAARPWLVMRPTRLVPNRQRNAIIRGAFTSTGLLPISLHGVNIRLQRRVEMVTFHLPLRLILQYSYNRGFNINDVHLPTVCRTVTIECKKKAKFLWLRFNNVRDFSDFETFLMRRQSVTMHRNNPEKQCVSRFFALVKSDWHLWHEVHNKHIILLNKTCKIKLLYKYV